MLLAPSQLAGLPYCSAVASIFIRAGFITAGFSNAQIQLNGNLLERETFKCGVRNGSCHKYRL